MPQYKKAELVKYARQAIEDGALTFTEIAALMPINRATFYNRGLNKLDEIREALEEKRQSVKVIIKKKWLESNNFGAQIALFKLLATPEERKILSQSYQDVTTKGKALTEVEKMTDKQREAEIKKLQKITGKTG